MPKTVTINIPEGYTTHKGVSHKILLREPTVEDYLDLGEIYNLVPASDGLAYPIESKEAVRKYTERLMIEPTDQLLVAGLPLSVGRDLREAVMSFFRRPVAAGEQSTTSGKTSSGEQTDGSAQTTSSE